MFVGSMPEAAAIAFVDLDKISFEILIPQYRGRKPVSNNWLEKDAFLSIDKKSIGEGRTHFKGFVFQLRAIGASEFKFVELEFPEDLTII